MTTRELWQNIMHYGEFDRMPVIHWAGWAETRQRWIEEGMPPDTDEHTYFNTVPHWTGVSTDLGLLPAFEEEVLEETDEYRIFRDVGGVVQKDWKHQSCIPHYIDFTFKEARDWDEYKKRLQPDAARIPENIDEQIAVAEASGLPIAISTASMMGWLRNWMGVPNMSYLMYDDPDCVADVVDTLADLSCWAMDQIIPRMTTKPDMGFGWEDICGKSGPLVSPTLFDQCFAPGYLKMRNKLEEYGIGLLGIDSDGMVEPLIENWMNVGVNVQFPIEYGTWQATPEYMRERFGKELRIVGGFNKLVLEEGAAAIDRDLERHAQLMTEGGFVVMPDHLITPDTSLENYKYYLDCVRRLRW